MVWEMKVFSYSPMLKRSEPLPHALVMTGRALWPPECHAMPTFALKIFRAVTWTALPFFFSDLYCRSNAALS